jgi:hypothetical protein
MNEVLKNELCQYLGELMYKHEHEFDWILKDALAEKINAINKLLDIDKHEKTWYEKVAEKLKTKL